MRKEIYFDIDNTLINTKLLSQLLYEQIAEKVELPVERIIEIKDIYKSNLESNTDFYPDDLIKFIFETIGVDGADFESPFNDKSIYQKSLFKETIDVLEKLKADYSLGIYSEGFEDYQTKKLVMSGIIDYFDKDLITIERRKLNDESVKKINNGSTVIDDNKKVVEKLKNYDSFKTVWINRDEGEVFENAEAVRDLTEITDLLNK